MRPSPTPQKMPTRRRNRRKPPEALFTLCEGGGIILFPGKIFGGVRFYTIQHCVRGRGEDMRDGRLKC